MVKEVPGKESKENGLVGAEGMKAAPKGSVPASFSLTVVEQILTTFLFCQMDTEHEMPTYQ